MHILSTVKSILHLPCCLCTRSSGVVVVVVKLVCDRRLWWQRSTGAEIVRSRGSGGGNVARVRSKTMEGWVAKNVIYDVI